MNPQYIYLYSAIKDKDLVSTEVIQYFTNADYLDILSAMYMLKNANADMTRDNMIGQVIRQSRNEVKQKELVDLINGLYKNTYAIPDSPLEVLKNNYVRTICGKMKDFACEERSESELRAFAENLNQRLAMTSHTGDVGRYSELTRDILMSTEDKPIISSIQVNSELLRRFLGPKLYGQKYTFTGVPGGYKTTLKDSIVIDLLKTDALGLSISYEDNKKFTAAKTYATQFKRDKIEVISGRANKWRGDLEKMKGDFFIADRGRNAKETNDIIRQYVLKYKIKWVTIDFHQLVNPYGKQTETDAINELDMYLHNIAIDYEIPIIDLSQTNADIIRDVQKGRELDFGSEQGGSKMIQKSRYAYYLTPVAKEISTGMSKILMKCGKATFGNFTGKKWHLIFHGPTGELCDVTEVEENKK